MYLTLFCTYLENVIHIKKLFETEKKKQKILMFKNQMNIISLFHMQFYV